MSKRTVLITGSNGGIGQALCGGFADAGWQVIATDEHEKALTPVDSFFTMDLNRFAIDESYRQDAEEELFALVPNGLDCLVNNAAYQVVASVDKLKAAEWHSTMNINVTAPFLLVKALRERLARVTGNVINISSVHAKLTKPDFTAYATSKAALEGLTRSLAVELGSTLRVNAISPAAIATPMLKAGLMDGAHSLDALAGFHPTDSIGSPDEVAEIAIAIANFAGNFLNGAIIGVDGGIAGRLHDPG